MQNLSNFKTLTTEELLTLNVGDTVKAAAYNEKNELVRTFDLKVVETEKSDLQWPICVEVPVSLINDAGMHDIMDYCSFIKEGKSKGYWLDESTSAGSRIVAIKGENCAELSSPCRAEFDQISKLEILKEKLKQTNLFLFSFEEKPKNLEDLRGYDCFIRRVKEIRGNRIVTVNHGLYDEGDYADVDAIRIDEEGNIIYL